ncbi:major facilitator superfamily domain-containing protein [Mucidula mucida]|nr:major facilitator superfamily domain-containing protein [Mucidula mucida]
MNEETHLLEAQPERKRTPLPWSQLPLTSQVIFPFAPQLMRDIGVTHGDERQVGYYVGFMQSLFFLTQAFTVLQWSRLSDHIGRKPVILSGLCGLAISMYSFGLSRTFLGLVLSRSLNGALNGNIGVIKSMVAELTDATNIAEAYSYIPIASCSGAIIGPIIGGALARPADQFPSLFGNSQFLKDYPYFLPCAIPATFTVVAWTITFLFLEETVKQPKSFRSLVTEHISAKSQTTTITSDVSDNDGAEKPLPLRSLLIRQVIIAGGNYAMLSLLEITFRAIQPVFMSTPIELGGLGLSTSAIGKILSTYGVLNALFQFFVFARLDRLWGTKTTFTVGIASALPAFGCYPVMTALIRTQGRSSMVWAVLAFQVASSIVLSLSYGAVFIYITAASPNRASLGATNGLCQMVVSIFRTIGPAAADSLYSASLKHQLLNGFLVYYVLMASVFVALLVASLLPTRLK